MNPDEGVDESRKTSRTYSLDSSSVKEIDQVGGFEEFPSDDDGQNRSPPQTAEQTGRKKGGGAVGDGFLDDEGPELEDLLNAGKEELLKTSVLSLKHLPNEKIVSLMQLISDIGSDSLHSSSRPPLPKLSLLYSAAPGMRLWGKLIARMKTFVAIRAVSSPRSQFFRMITMSKGRSQRGTAVQMSEAVAEVLAGRYLPHLHHLALPPCHIPTIARALITGRVSTLQQMELQGQADFSSTRSLRRLFMSGLVEGLQHLSLSNCIAEEEMEGLAAALDSGKLTCLRYLDLSGNSFRGSSGSRGLATLMSCRALVGLEHLNLHNCGLGDEEMQAFASAVMARGPWKLNFLNVGSNDIGDVGFAWLLRLIKADRLPQLQELHLLYNYRIGDESKIEAARLLETGHAPRLQLMYLSSHIVSERVAESLLRAFRNNTRLFVELPNALWPNEHTERGVATFRERNLGLLFNARKSMH